MNGLTENIVQTRNVFRIFRFPLTKETSICHILNDIITGEMTYFFVISSFIIIFEMQVWYIYEVKLQDTIISMDMKIQDCPKVSRITVIGYG